MITIDVENKTIAVTNLDGISFKAGDFEVPITDGTGFIANLPDEFFTRDFTVSVVTEVQQYIAPVPEPVEEPVIEEEIIEEPEVE